MWFISGLFSMLNYNVSHITNKKCAFISRHFKSFYAVNAKQKFSILNETDYKV